MILRKFIALCIVTAVLAVPVGSLCIDWRLSFGPMPWFGYLFFAIGALASVTNFCLSFLRYPLFILSGGSRDDFRFISGFPLIGMFGLFGLVLIPASSSLSVATLVLLLIDTGNIPWFVVSMWRDSSFWE